MPAATGPAWTDERVSVLKKLWTEGLSASAIAKQLGGVSRNAVIGKVHRLGLPHRSRAAAVDNWRAATAERQSGQPSPPRKIPAKAKPLPPVREAKAKSPKAPKVLKPSVAEAFVPLAPKVNRLPASPNAPEAGEPLHLTVTELKTGHCRWPLGDGPFTFCGCATVDPQDPTVPYCAHHAWKARRRDTGSPYVPGLIRPDFKRSKPGRAAMYRQAAGKAAWA